MNTVVIIPCLYGTISGQKIEHLKISQNLHNEFFFQKRWHQILMWYAHPRYMHQKIFGNRKDRKFFQKIVQMKAWHLHLHVPKLCKKQMSGIWRYFGFLRTEYSEKQKFSKRRRFPFEYFKSHAAPTISVLGLLVLVWIKNILWLKNGTLSANCS